MPSTIVEREDNLGNKHQKHLVDGRVYPNYIDVNGEEDYSLVLDAVRDMELNPKDVFVTGYLKSGNHWFFEVVNMVFYQNEEYAPGVQLESSVDMMSVEQIKALDAPRDPKILCANLNVDSNPKSITTKGVKLIYIVRNFKDVLVSAYTFMHRLQVYNTYKGPWEIHMDLYTDPAQSSYGTWFEHIRSADQFRKDYPNVPFHILCFEKMKLNPVEEIKSLAKFLEVDMPDDLAQKIADKVSFKKMTSQLLAGKMRKTTDRLFGVGSDGYFRKGVIGDWKNTFTVAQSERIDAMVKAELPNSPIADIIKPFM